MTAGSTNPIQPGKLVSDPAEPQGSPRVPADELGQATSTPRLGVRVISDPNEARAGEAIWRRKDGLMIAGRANSEELFRFRRANQEDAHDWGQVHVPRARRRP